MLRRIRQIGAYTYIIFTILLLCPQKAQAASSTSYPIHDIMTGIIQWKSGFLDSDYMLQSNIFLTNAGNEPYDTYALSLARLGNDRGYDSYLSLLFNNVSSLYAKGNASLEKTALNWQSTALTILSLGGNPASMTNTINETKINLLADYGYNVVTSSTNKKVDAKALAHTLILIDTLDYSIPADSVYTREGLIRTLLESQRNDGSFSSAKQDSDTAVTAFVIQALAPFYNEETTYYYRDSASEHAYTVRSAVDNAISFLSSKQTRNGDIKNGSVPSLESTAQTLSACASLGIDPYTDQRFILNNHNLLDGLLRYQMSDGGFSDQPTTERFAMSNDNASLLALNSLISFYRYRHHQRDFFDMREEFSNEVREQIITLEEQIAALKENASSAELQTLYESYQSLNPCDRRYVYHYAKLSEAMTKKSLSKDMTSFTAGYNKDTSENGCLYNIINNCELTITKNFIDDDYYNYQDLPETLTLNNYNMVTILYCKLVNTHPDHFHLRTDTLVTYDQLLKDLKIKKTGLETTMAKIDSINEQIRTKLTSLTAATKEDKELIDQLVYQASTMSPADQKNITSYKDLLAAQERLSPQNTTARITCLLIILFLLLWTPFLYRHFKK